MKTKRILSFVLTLAMLLTLFSGELANAAGMKVVTAGEELAYDPLAEAASIAYEQHDAGYAVSLDRAADSVTMHVTAVPGGRSADKARLYVRTGVALKAGTAYRVSFALSSEKKLADYTINFDGNTAAAYGKLDKRSIEAGATDRVEYTVTPKAASGELVLRLLLGKTEVNTLRFSNLSVEEAPAEQSGANKLLVDKLNYAAPGAIRCAAEAGYSAEMTSTDSSATMTVTNVPKSGAEVWKLKLMVSTGLKPEPGKTYRFRATLNSSNSGSYEACYNEGEVEKGYDVLYNQSLKSGSQVIERMIYVPTDKENPGELIVQFSLGKLSKGTKVTISKVTVEEASPAYTNALAKGFALDATDRFETYDPNNLIVTGSTEVATNIDWTCPAVVTADKWADTGGLTTGMDIIEDKAVINIKHGFEGEGHGCWESRLIINTDTAVETTKFYRVSFTMNSTQPYSGDNKFEVLLGDGAGSEACAAFKSLILEANEDTPLAFSFQPSTSVASLFVTLQIGTNNGDARTVTISDFKLEEVTEGDEETLDLSSSLTYPDADDGIYELNTPTKGEDNSKNTAVLSTENNAVKLQVTGTEGPSGSDTWLTKLIFNTGIHIDPSKTYKVSFSIKRKTTTNSTANWDVSCGQTADGWVEDAFGTFNKPKEITTEGVSVEVPLNSGAPTTEASKNQPLRIFFKLGGTLDTYWISNVTVKENDVIVWSQPTFGSFGINNMWDRPGSGALSGNGSSATLKPLNGWKEKWERELFANNITGADLIPGDKYTVDFNISTTDNIHAYTVQYNLNNYEGGYSNRDVTPNPSSLSHSFIAYAAGKLTLQLQLGGIDATTYTISNITVKHTPYTPVSGSPLVSGFSSVGYVNYSDDQQGGNFRENVSLARNPGNAQLTVKRNDSYESTAMANFYAQLKIRTGVMYEPGENYQIKFDIKATSPQKEFVVLWEGVPDTEDLRGTWGQSIAAAGQTKTITTRALPASLTTPGGEIAFRIELGNLDPDVALNKFTISNVRVYKVSLTMAIKEARETGTVTNDMQEGYTVPLTRAKDSATVAINATPATGMEAWKHKLFIDTGVNVSAGEAYRVFFDVLPENDMDFEVCYNRNTAEKGFTAIYGLHAAAGMAKTVEKMVFAENSGKLIVQLSLGNVPAPNKVTVRNFRVERVKYSYSGKSALPAEITYQAGDVSYWAHADYAASFTNTADSVTAHITPPAKNPEPWKVKLFLDTGVALQGGKYYKVTTDVSAKKSQNYEICYNNGGIEFGYDSMGGLKVTGGKTERIEKLISVPANKKDTNNLMLQINLGKTAIANDVTISNVTVEEVTLAYANALGKDFSYQKSLSTWTDPKTTYKATVDSASDAATLHISGVPTSGTGVWMVKLFVHTGAMLEAGKSYQVSADLLAAKAQDFETCFNNEETEKGFDAIYGQKFAAGVKTTVDKRISVPASMTDAGELVLQFSVGGAVANDITISNVSVQELQYGGSDSASPIPDTVIDLSQSAQAAGTLDVTREKLIYHMTKIAADAKDNAIKVAGADLRSGDLYTVAFTAKASKELTGTLALAQSGGKTTVISKPFTLTPTEQTYSFATTDALTDGGAYDIFWQFGSADNQKLGSADVELSGISVSVPTERLEVVRSVQKVTVNGKAVAPDIYNINGSNYFKLRDLAVLLNGTNGQFVVRYNPQTNGVSLTTDKEYTPIGGELTIGPDLAATCVRSPQDVTVNGKAVNLKVYNIGGSNFFRLRDLNELLGFDVDYEAKTNTVLIASPLTPERQEASYAYNVFFRPEIDGESQPYVGDTMPFYDNGTYYIYYLKEGGDSYNHSVYLTTTKDFVHYTERPTPVLDASRADVQDSWIGTGSVVKADKDYYFFYTGFNASGSQEYHEKIMVAKGSSPTSFTKVSGWSITPPAELNQKNDFRDPQAYYDPATGTISLTVTASKDGTARILKYTLGKDLSNVKYDGVIFTDPTGAFYNLECSDTFRLGNKWYLTYSGQEDTLWYASADSRFGPYSAPKRMDGTIFYAAKHVENGKNSYMVGWTRRSASASSTDEVSGWGGNLAVQQLKQNADGSLSMIPVESIASAFNKSVALSATSATLTAGSGYSYKKAFTSSESFKLTGEFTYTGAGSLGLAFDFDGTEDQYKLISVDPAEGKLKLLFNGGATQIAETQAKLAANQKHTFTYIQDGSVGIFYLDGQAALTVRLYGVTDKPIYLFAENNSVTFTSLQQFTR